ncbi:MAG: peptidoglycan DD-metalloendopeptidase family protein [Paracoccaceae bacterium]
MRVTPSRRLLKGAAAGLGLLVLGACEPDGSFDGDFRNFGGIGFDTSAAAQDATLARPTPDARGVISYPTYQVAVARPGDTVEAIALRVGAAPGELGAYNAIPPGTQFRGGEVLALPGRGGAGGPLPGALPPGGGGAIDVTTIASGAIDRAQAGGAGTAPAGSAASSPSGAEPVRHQVVRGETAYTIARLYNVNVRALAEWNGLGADLAVREGQYLLIPLASAPAPAVAEAATGPGQGSPTPEPPSAGKPLPVEKAAPAPDAAAAPDLGADKTAASGAKFAMPVAGKIIRGYQEGKTAGIDIAAAAGTAVRASADGTVLITKTAQGSPLVVVRHSDELLTVYANVDGVAVAKGDKVKRGQELAKVKAGDPAYLHFQVRRGVVSIDPMPFLQ